MPVDKKDLQILIFVSLPLMVVLLFISFFRETLAHWPGPAYSSMLILTAIKLASGTKQKTDNIPIVIKFALAFVVLIALLESLLTNYYPGTLSHQKQGLQLGADDVTLDMYGWKKAGKVFDSLYKSDIAKKLMPLGAPIVVTSWFPAAHIDFYIADCYQNPMAERINAILKDEFLLTTCADTEQLDKVIDQSIFI